MKEGTDSIPSPYDVQLHIYAKAAQREHDRLVLCMTVIGYPMIKKNRGRAANWANS